MCVCVSACSRTNSDSDMPSGILMNTLRNANCHMCAFLNNYLLLVVVLLEAGVYNNV